MGHRRAHAVHHFLDEAADRRAETFRIYCLQGDLAGSGRAIVLAVVALLIGWESFLRLANLVGIDFGQA